MATPHICYQQLLNGLHHKFSRQSVGGHDLAANYIRRQGWCPCAAHTGREAKLQSAEQQRESACLFPICVSLAALCLLIDL